MTETIDIDKSVSDHKGVVAIIDVSVPILTTFKREIILYKNANFDLLNSLILNFDWNLYFFDSDLDTSVDLFYHKLNEFINICIPKKWVTIRPFDKPWFNSDIRKAIRIRNRLRKIAIRTKSEKDVKKYKLQHNRVNRP